MAKQDSYGAVVQKINQMDDLFEEVKARGKGTKVQSVDGAETIHTWQYVENAAPAKKYFTAIEVVGSSDVDPRYSTIQAKQATPQQPSQDPQPQPQGRKRQPRAKQVKAPRTKTRPPSSGNSRSTQTEEPPSIASTGPVVTEASFTSASVSHAAGPNRMEASYTNISITRSRSATPTPVAAPRSASPAPRPRPRPLEQILADVQSIKTDIRPEEQKPAGNYRIEQIITTSFEAGPHLRPKPVQQVKPVQQAKPVPRTPPPSPAVTSPALKIAPPPAQPARRSRPSRPVPHNTAGHDPNCVLCVPRATYSRTPSVSSAAINLDPAPVRNISYTHVQGVISTSSVPSGANNAPSQPRPRQPRAQGAPSPIRTPQIRYNQPAVPGRNPQTAKPGPRNPQRQQSAGRNRKGQQSAGGSRQGQQPTGGYPSQNPYQPAGGIPSNLAQPKQRKAEASNFQRFPPTVHVEP